MVSHALELAVAADRDASSEAWVFVAGGLLFSAVARLGGPLTEEDFVAIVHYLIELAEGLRLARSAFDWLSGRAGVEDMLDALFGRFCLGK